MPEDQPERRMKPLFDEAAPPTEPGTEHPPLLRRRWVWLGAALALGAVVAAAFALTYAQPSKEETAATRAAVKHFAELFNQPPGKVYKYCKIGTKSLGNGDWRVEITRVVVDDPKAGYGFTSHFKVDRNGKSEYTGQTEGRGD